MKHVLLLGRTGVGKSSYVNSAFGVPVALTDQFESCTRLVEYHTRETALGRLSIIDTPGMAEADAERDDRYLRLIRDSVDISSLHSVMYLTRLDETRFRPEERYALQRITQVLSSLVWQRSQVVLTFAASVPADRRKAQARRRVADLRRELSQYVVSQDLKLAPVWLVDNVSRDWSGSKISVLDSLMSDKKTGRESDQAK